MPTPIQPSDKLTGSALKALITPRLEKLSHYLQHETADIRALAREMRAFLELIANEISARELEVPFKPLKEAKFSLPALLRHYGLQAKKLSDASENMKKILDVQAFVLTQNKEYRFIVEALLFNDMLLQYDAHNSFKGSNTPQWPLVDEVDDTPNALRDGLLGMRNRLQWLLLRSRAKQSCSEQAQIERAFAALTTCYREQSQGKAAPDLSAFQAHARTLKELKEKLEITYLPVTDSQQKWTWVHVDRYIQSLEAKLRPVVEAATQQAALREAIAKARTENAPTIANEIIEEELVEPEIEPEKDFGVERVLEKQQAAIAFLNGLLAKMNQAITTSNKQERNGLYAALKQHLDQKDQLTCLNETLAQQITSVIQQLAIPPKTLTLRRQSRKQIAQPLINAIQTAIQDKIAACSQLTEEQAAQSRQAETAVLAQQVAWEEKKQQARQAKQEKQEKAQKESAEKVAAEKAALQALEQQLAEQEAVREKQRYESLSSTEKLSEDIDKNNTDAVYAFLCTHDNDHETAFLLTEAITSRIQAQFKGHADIQALLVVRLAAKATAEKIYDELITYARHLGIQHHVYDIRQRATIALSDEIKGALDTTQAKKLAKQEVVMALLQQSGITPGQLLTHGERSKASPSNPFATLRALSAFCSQHQDTINHVLDLRREMRSQSLQRLFDYLRALWYRLKQSPCPAHIVHGTLFRQSVATTLAPVQAAMPKALQDTRLHC